MKKELPITPPEGYEIDKERIIIELENEYEFSEGINKAIQIIKNKYPCQD